MAQAAVASYVPVENAYSAAAFTARDSTLLVHKTVKSSHTVPSARDTPPSLQADPHQLPTFSRSTSPILYLPPLLSSLPRGYPQPSLPSAPRVTPLSSAARLPSIDSASLALHRALHHFRAVTPEYSSIPYAEAFNWGELELPEEEEREWYCVAFRSKRRESSDGGPLYEADKKAHEEAVQNGGLILYWYGTPHPETGVNLATCIWQSRAHAAAANSRPHHVRAMRLAAISYERYELERYCLLKVRGQRGVEVTPFVGGSVERLKAGV
ncbi:hypothetical protein BKA93DRAFT_17205 [Sparassis latifolia]